MDDTARSDDAVPGEWTDHVYVNASNARVWLALTDPAHLPRWMGEPELRISVATDWRIGAPITIRGFHHVPFENRGVVLAFDPPHALGYRYLSSLSGLADEPANQTHLHFELAEENGGTRLTLAAHGFPTDAIFHHTTFYWAGTLHVLKAYVEGLDRE